MIEPILVDTSVWINFFKGIDSAQVEALTRHLENDDPVYLCPTVIQEILQGIVSDRQFREIKEYLLAFPILNDNPVTIAVEAAGLYRLLRRRRVTVRKSNDCLIAQYAINHQMKILHQDRDFDLILNNYK